MKKIFLNLFVALSLIIPLHSEKASISADEPIAVEVGKRIILSGGNAVDSAVAIGFAMAVTFPQAGNIGGGGFMLIKFKNKEPDFIDYRETAPKGFDIKRFFENGKFVPERSLTGYLAIGVAGSVKGFYTAWKKYGKLPWKRLIEPSIELAEKGFVVRPYLSRSIIKHKKRFKLFKDSKRIFLRNGKYLIPGDILIQKDLAETLRIIAEKGDKGFYEGEIAEKIEKDFIKHNGFIRKEDLKNYRAVFRKPIIVNYKGYEIILPSLPSSGGVVIAEILNILENFKIPQEDKSYFNLLAEAMKLAFYDRTMYMGDPDFSDIPQEIMLNKEYAKRKAKLIKIGKVLKIKGKSLPSPFNFKHSTTHFSIVDRDGNIVSNTYTLNSIFGSAVVIEGTGILANNEIDDFGFGENVKNQFGLLTSKYNLAEPQKRMLSSMSPAIVLKGGKPVLITGAAGGPKIISSTIQIILNYIERGFSPEKSVFYPRIHHQCFPDILFVEKGMKKEAVNHLIKLGYKVKFVNSIAVSNTIVIENGKQFAFSDKGHYGKGIVF